MWRFHTSFIVQLCFTSISAFSLLDFAFQSSLNSIGGMVDPSGVAGTSTDLPQDVWDMAPLTGLTSMEASLINRLRSIAERRPSTSDCFKRSVSALKAKCGGELESDEGERVRLAISMALCELETAAYAAIPLECLNFSHGARARATENRSTTHAACVAALSRSPQHWSSYSGYLRDVPQLCFAFRKWADIDTAHLIQRNTSIEALNLLILLRDREETESGRQQQVKRTMDAMELMQRDLQGSVDRVREVPREALIEAGEMIAQLFSQYSVRVDELHESMALRMQHSHEIIIRELRQAMMSTAEKHSEAMAITWKTAEDHSRHSYRLLQRQYVLASTALDFLNARWQNLTILMLAVHESTEAVLASALHVSSELDTQFQKLAQHQEVIEKVASSMNTLSASLDYLTTLAEDRLISINSTAWEIKSSLLASRTPGRLFQAGADLLWRVYLKLDHLGIRSISMMFYLVYYMLPACWYVLQGTRIFGGIAMAIARQTGVCLSTALSVTQTILLELFSLVMKMLSWRRLKSHQRVGTRYHDTESYPLEQLAVKETQLQTRGQDAQPHRTSIRLPPAPSKRHVILTRNPDRGSLRSMSLPPLMIGQRPRQ